MISKSIDHYDDIMADKKNIINFNMLSKTKDFFLFLSNKRPKVFYIPDRDSRFSMTPIRICLYWRLT